jgi:ornithine cyclodeaminase/alanine dehydrogenase-like protein (mu-crystallin family)
MDAAEITAARTAAASGACARRLAPQGWRRAAILGCGEQGRFHAAALRALGGPEVEIAVFDPRPERAAGVGAQARPAPDARTAVAGAQVVVTAGPIVERPQPVVEPDWLEDQHLLLPIDFDALLTAAAVDLADLVLADDIAQFEYYHARGHFEGWPVPHASVGEALAGGDGARRVVCVNLGVGALDAVFAGAVLKAAREADAGTELAR